VVDGFIDAMIAVENLFGNESSELSFRISTALAFLLARELEARRLACAGNVVRLDDKRDRSR
jgi:hypothetical protein